MSSDIKVDEIIRFRKGTPVGIFDGLDAQQLASISSIMKRHCFKSGDTITRDGEEGDAMYLLLSGEVKVSKQLFLKTSKVLGQVDKEIVILKAATNPYFGELALFDAKSLRMATVTAIKDCECAVMLNHDFLKLSDSKPEIGYPVMKNIVSNLAGTIKKQNENILNLTTALSIALSAS